MVLSEQLTHSEQTPVSRIWGEAGKDHRASMGFNDAGSMMHCWQQLSCGPSKLWKAQWEEPEQDMQSATTAEPLKSLRIKEQMASLDRRGRRLRCRLKEIKKTLEVKLNMSEHALNELQNN